MGGLHASPGKRIRHRRRRRINPSRPPPTPPTIGRPRPATVPRPHGRARGNGIRPRADQSAAATPTWRRGTPAKTRRARAGETSGQAPAARLTGRAPSSQPPRLHASLRPSYADAPATRAMTIPCVRGADTTREPTWRSGLRVGRVARANVTRPVKESATT